MPPEKLTATVVFDPDVLQEALRNFHERLDEYFNEAALADLDRAHGTRGASKRRRVATPAPRPVRSFRLDGKL